MSRWIYTVDISDVWKVEGWSFEQTRDAVVALIRSSRWYAERADEDLEDVCVELEDAQTVAEFDAVWRDLYDVADEHRAWIDTLGRRPR